MKHGGEHGIQTIISTSYWPHLSWLWSQVRCPPPTPAIRGSRGLVFTAPAAGTQVLSPPAAVRSDAILLATRTASPPSAMAGPAWDPVLVLNPLTTVHLAMRCPAIWQASRTAWRHSGMPQPARGSLIALRNGVAATGSGGPRLKRLAPRTLGRSVLAGSRAATSVPIAGLGGPSGLTPTAIRTTTSEHPILLRT